MNRIFFSFTLLSALCIPNALMADETTEVQCQSNEVKVCFADGTDPSCYCKVRTVEITDTPDGDIPCYDEDDDGNC